MCLRNYWSDNKVNEFKKHKPKEFYVYKATCDKRHSEFQSPNEPDFKTGTMEARRFSCRRTKVFNDDRIGFNVFFTKKEAKKYIGIRLSGLLLTKFKAHKEWIKTIGNTSICSGGLRVGILSHIEVLPFEER